MLTQQAALRLGP